MTNVDLRLLAVAVCLVRIDRLKNPHREQAKAYRGLHSRCQIEMHSKCGSELAREGASEVSANRLLNSGV